MPLRARRVRPPYGPYYEWSHLKAGRLHHRTLTPAGADLMRQAIGNDHKARKLLRTWERHTEKLIELTAPNSLPTLISRREIAANALADARKMGATLKCRALPNHLAASALILYTR